MPAGGVVEAFFYGFGGHGFAGRFEGEEDADGGLFAVDDVAAFDGEGGAFRFGARTLLSA